MNRTVSHETWNREATERFGADPMGWKFVCPVCGHVASIKDWKEAGAGQNEVAFSCVGRHRPGAKQAFADGSNELGCTYAGGGLFKLNPVTVTFPDGKTLDAFEFAERP